VKVHRRASFRATATDFWGPLTFSWRFGPHAIATGPSVQHTFSKPGIKQVKLTVTDGAKLTVSRTVSVRVTRPARKHRRHRKHRARRA
jgi:PKD repeat protein